MTIRHRPMVLTILDGWGYSEMTEYNAIHNADKPCWDRLWEAYPHTLLDCSGVDVGLPDGQMGNSEVGHMHLGAGRLVHQDFSRINAAIADGTFFANTTLLDPCRRAAARDKAVHIMGLLSPGGVHAHEDHILASLELAARCGVKRIFLHAFLDGRDMPPQSAADSLQLAMLKFRELGCGRIASLIGRYYAMDRNKHWDRTRAAYNLVVNGRAVHAAPDPLIALDLSYARGESDEFVQATVICPRDEDPVIMQDGDVVAFMNYRADRARQLTQSLIDADFDGFPRTRVPALDSFVSLTTYGDEFDIPAAFPPEHLEHVLGQYLAELGLQQLRIAETEKYAHVTFFFNGGEERAFEGEDRILVPSPHVATYDETPRMSAGEVTDELVAAINSGKYDAIICNYANADMVGHTGNYEATVEAVAYLDECIGRVVESVQARGGEMLITADHGNAEMMRGIATKMQRGQAHTAHTSNTVPLLYVGRQASMVQEGTLADVAPTMLYLMGIEKPPEMTGTSLVRLIGDDDAGAMAAGEEAAPIAKTV